jgi:hypothetical protein
VRARRARRPDDAVVQVHGGRHGRLRQGLKESARRLQTERLRCVSFYVLASLSRWGPMQSASVCSVCDWSVEIKRKFPCGEG